MKTKIFMAKSTGNINCPRSKDRRPTFEVLEVEMMIRYLDISNIVEGFAKEMEFSKFWQNY